MNVEQWSVDKLIPYTNNARTHSDEQVSQIADSIREFGFVNPVLVNGSNVIIAGHGRLLAAKKLGMTEVPVIVLGHLTEAQVKALTLADNKLAENAGWDEELLRIELKALQDMDFDLDLVGFDSTELDQLLLGDDEGLTDDDVIPEVDGEPVSKLGDLWLLGKHRVLCGSATTIDDVETLMGDQLADMCWSDPPYNVDYGNTVRNKIRGNNNKIMNDNLGEDFAQFLYDACLNILLKTKGAIYLTMSSSEIHTLQKAFAEAGGKWSTFIIWAKNHFTMGRSDYQRQYEPMLYGWKDGSDHYWCGDRSQSDVWFINKPVRNDLHPTMKPVELIERAIKNSSKTQDIVFDPFGGSGSTMIACEKTNRQARLIELDPKFVDVIVKRWQEYTGEKAALSANGKLFDELNEGNDAVPNTGNKLNKEADHA
ncbi:MAG: site-specific DNA-methyltransferase [Methylococcales bacterium]|jgi:DNA modification methylase|nr:site-specific DNA-methyltransferase [Methylococcales bacterium]